MRRAVETTVVVWVLVSLVRGAQVPSAMVPFAPDRDLATAAVLDRLSEGSEGRTLAVKKFDRRWVATLFDRGEPSVYGPEGFDYIGMPVSGIASGQLYLGGDGKLWHWDIFNTKRPTRVVQAYREPTRQNSPIEQGFALRITSGGAVQVWPLDRRGFTDITFLGQYPIGYVTYRDPAMPVTVQLEAFSPFIPLNLDESCYPATILRYTVTNTGSEPVEAELAGWLENAVCKQNAAAATGQRRNRIVRSPRFTFLNEWVQPVTPAESTVKRSEILFEDFEHGTYRGWTIEGEAFGRPGENLRRFHHHQPLRGVRGKHLADSFRNDGSPSARAPASDAPRGTLTSKPFRIERWSIRFLIGGGSHRTTAIRLLVEGKIVRTASGDNSETLTAKGWDVTDLAGKEAVIQIADDHSGGWGHVLVDHIVFTDDSPVPQGRLEDDLDFGTMGLAVVGPAAGMLGSADVAVSALPQAAFAVTPESVATKPLAAKLVGSVGRRLTLEPGGSETVTFVLAWFFPASGVPRLKTDTTRWYATRFSSAHEVAAAIVKDLDALASQTRLWKQTWYDSTLPHWFLDRTFLNTSTLATQTCFRFKDGRFYGTEGIYCCPGTCTHVWGYVQATGRLFPALEKALREKVDFREGISFYPASGAISFRGEIYGGPRTAVDGQSGIILRTYREHQVSPDDSFLRRVYPAAKKAMSYLIDTYDGNHDGILKGAQHNTLDADWYGKITWLSLYYCAALRAAEQMALDVGDAAYAKLVRTIADRGGWNIAEELFNGEYFVQLPDPNHPKSPGSFSGCEYSQLLGQGWAYQVGLGRIIDNEKVRTALRWMWRYNFTTDVGPFREVFTNGRWYAMPGEGGLLACTFPRGGQEVLGLGNQHFAGYLNECQNGYEYGATSLMMWEGMVDYAFAHTRTLHERYHPSRRNPWNEVECGEHYARSMASYGLFTAVCGFEYHGPRRYIAFSPRLTPENFRAAFTAAEGWGTFTQRREGSTQIDRLDVRWGKLQLQTLAFDLPRDARAKTVTVTVAGKPMEVSFTPRDNRVIVTLKKNAVIAASETMQVRMAWE